MWRLIIAVFLFLLSLMVLFKAPTNFLWRVSVAITEFPYIFIAAAVVLYIISYKADKYKTATLIISAITIVMYSSPMIQAYQRGKNLTEDLLKAFPFKNEQEQLQEPYSFGKMFSGIGITDVTPKTLTYKKLTEKDLNIDFFPSSTNLISPTVIIIHGGSWAEGDSKQLPALNSYLANKGYNVAAINYRLAPKYKSPAPVEDVKDALKYLIANSEKLNIDTSNFVLLGRSAGAQIALCAAYTFNDPKIRGVVSFYGPADMVWGARIKTNKLVLNTDKVFSDYLGGLIDAVPEKYHEAGAVDHITKNSTPTLIIHGEHDAMVAYEHSEHLNKKLEENKVQHYFLDLPWATHGCDYNINGPSGQITTFAIERFLNSVIKY
ncbi:MAG: alpha/beta hydrolase [Bacteroidetes bacterium]|nr:alpha/beta hydrolase [Bacteroidota bacterium]